MNKEKLMKSIINELKFHDNDFLLFIEENKDVKDSDFFENLKIQFPTLEYTFKLNEAINLRKTTDHLYYFKVLSIILMVLGIIGAMLSI
jgi:hypothetical protein